MIMKHINKILSGFISFLFHPVFVTLYVMAFLIYLHPSAFAGFSPEERRRVLVVVGLNAVFYPILTVLLLKALGFIGSVQLHEQKDRIIPLIASGIFYFWTFTVFREQQGYPELIRVFFLGIFLASSLALLLNIFLKVSLHAIGMGGWVGFFLLIAREGSMLMTWPLALVLLITGLVLSVRLFVSAHRPVEILFGFLAGALTQGVAYFFFIA